MNNQDRERLARLLIIDQVPFPSGTVQGQSLFTNDMRVILPLVKRCVVSIARSDAEWEDPEGDLQDLEDYIQLRVAQRWQ